MAHEHVTVRVEKWQLAVGAVCLVAAGYLAFRWAGHRSPVPVLGAVAFGAVLWLGPVVRPLRLRTADEGLLLRLPLWPRELAIPWDDLAALHTREAKVFGGTRPVFRLEVARTPAVWIALVWLTNHRRLASWNRIRFYGGLPGGCDVELVGRTDQAELDRLVAVVSGHAAVNPPDPYEF
ncbi:hypothetical protein ACIA8O_04430 [Kitasatospora sp. NPDC051853]|uniref:hypothetical protein n=1 Tax=Kitasatospora sp. NPDC051853 TaxID=3364058 RepID=UPI0037A58271